MIESGSRRQIPNEIIKGERTFPSFNFVPEHSTVILGSQGMHLVSVFVGIDAKLVEIYEEVIEDVLEIHLHN